MGVITRYILRELGVTFLFGFVALTGLLLTFGLVREAMAKHLTMVYIVQLIPFILAEMAPISLPVTLLLAVTIFFSKMSGNNEVIALKALGIPPKAFLMPVFVIAFVISIVGVGINELAITWGQRGIRAVIYYGADDILFEQLIHDHSFETSNRQISISVQGVDGQRKLIKPTIIVRKEGIIIEAETAKITVNFAAEILTIKFVGMKISGGSIGAAFPERDIQIPLSEIVPSAESKRPARWGLYRISKEKKNTIEQIEQQRRIIAAHRTFGAAVESADAWANPRTQIIDAQTGTRSLQSHYNKLSVEPPRRWATGFSCFFFVWLGAPLAIWMRKSDFFSSFFACFVPILVLYYPLMMFGFDQAKSGTLPPASVWLANAAIGLVGLWFLRQIHRY